MACFLFANYFCYLRSAPDASDMLLRSGASPGYHPATTPGRLTGGQRC